MQRTTLVYSMVKLLIVAVLVMGTSYVHWSKDTMASHELSSQELFTSKDSMKAKEQLTM